ncbi:MAG: hypothetical protein QOG87_3355 [Actinomycetota bacterium]|jgi:hypothetical protein
MPTVNISEDSAAKLEELWAGLQATHQDPRTQAELVEDAIRRVHRGFFGDPPDPQKPQESTGPFRKWASDRYAEVLLRQIDATTFALVQPFRYADDQGRRFNVVEDDVSDLASVPRFLTWLVPRYGRHTLAALLHDHLQPEKAAEEGSAVTARTPSSPEDPKPTSEVADAIFRDAMGQTGVPFSRRWLMWSAVALRTEWNRKGLRRARVVGWVAVFLPTAVLLWPAVAMRFVTNSGWRALGLGAAAFVGAALVPTLLAFPVWWKQWRIGALSGAALLYFSVQMVLVSIALGLYLGFEWLIEQLAVRRPEQRNPVLARNMKD